MNENKIAVCFWNNFKFEISKFKILKWYITFRYCVCFFHQTKNKNKTNKQKQKQTINITIYNKCSFCCFVVLKHAPLSFFTCMPTWWPHAHLWEQKAFIAHFYLYLAVNAFVNSCLMTRIPERKKTLKHLYQGLYLYP